MKEKIKILIEFLLCFVKFDSDLCPVLDSISLGFDVRVCFFAKAQFEYKLPFVHIIVFVLIGLVSLYDMSIGMNKGQFDFFFSSEMNGICLRKPILHTTHIAHVLHCDDCLLSLTLLSNLSFSFVFRVPLIHPMSMSSSISIRNIVISFYFSIENKNWFVVVHL